MFRHQEVRVNLNTLLDGLFKAIEADHAEIRAKDARIAELEHAVAATAAKLNYLTNLANGALDGIG